MTVKQKKNPMLYWLSIGIDIIIIIWLSSALFLYKYIPTDSDRGTFGDMFGAINALFSGVALIGIVVNIIFQQKELGFQKDEMELTRKEFEIIRYTGLLLNKVEKLHNQLYSIEVTYSIH